MFKLGYAAFARLVAQSPLIDGVMVVVTARRSAFLVDDQPKLIALARETKKPVFLWSYTLPSDKSVEVLNEAGYPLFNNADSCARTMCAMADYRARRERVAPQQTDGGWTDRAAARALLDAGAPVLCEWQARPSTRDLWYRRRRTRQARPSAAVDEAPPRLCAAGRAQGAIVRHSAQDRSRRSGAQGCRARDVRAGFDRVLAATKKHAPSARIDGVLVQPMAAIGREVILGVNRDPTWGPLLMVGLGGVLVEALGDVALAPVPLDHAAARALSAASRARPYSVPIAAHLRPTSTP